MGVLYSNTTLVKVKLSSQIVWQMQIRYSNTTLVKVKLMKLQFLLFIKVNSNTTLVKVKSKAKSIVEKYYKFKYNSC